MLYNVSVRLTGNKKKLKPNYIGPFEIIQIKNDGLNVKLREIANPVNEFNGHIKHIKLYHNDVDTPVNVLLEYVINDINSTSTTLDSINWINSINMSNNNSLQNDILTLELELNNLEPVYKHLMCISLMNE